MEFPDILLNNQGAAERVRRSDREIDAYWSSVVTEEPVSDDLKILIKADLKKAWHFRREVRFREDTKMRWSTTDDLRIVLEDTVGKVESTKLMYLCNKPTAFYWLQSAQQTVSSGERAHTPRIIFAAIYEKWVRCHDTPNIEYGHFFANPIRITSAGPSTVRGIIDAHYSLCTQASSLMRQLPFGSQNYSLLPLYHAIVVIIDSLHWVDNDYDPKESDGLISLHKLAQRQTVLVARTGREEGLSAPISFKSLKSQSLPLERPDVVTQDVDVVRVSLATAVQFIISLEVREDLASLKMNNELPLDTSLCPYRPKGFEENAEVCHCPEAWTDAVMVAAEKHGYDNILDAWESIRRVQAGLIGEGFCEFEPQPFGRRWKW